MTNEELKKMLGSPCINVELDDKQIDVVRNFTEKQAKSLIKDEKDFDYVFEALFVINCKKIWATGLMKYLICSSDCNVNGDGLYDAAIKDERNFLSFLKILNVKGWVDFGNGVNDADF